MDCWEYNIFGKELLSHFHNKLEGKVVVIFGQPVPSFVVGSISLRRILWLNMRSVAFKKNPAKMNQK